MADLTESGAEEMRDRLLKRLNKRRPAIKELHNYYDGNHRLPALPSGCNQDVLALREWAVLNLCPLVVNAVDERLEVKGFKFGAAGSAGVVDPWDVIWQPNQLDAISGLVHQEALIARRSFCLVWPREGGGVDVFPETPDEVIVDYEPGSRARRRAALKSFNDDGVLDITLWTSSQVWRWRSDRRGVAGSDPIMPRMVLREADGNPLGNVVPIVEFRSLPDLRGVAHSELDRGVIRIQDSINKTKFDRLVLQEFQAFPQRWATGIDPETDEKGVVVNPVKVGPNRVVTNTSDLVKFGQWDAADLKPLLDATTADIHALAAVTKTPVHYLAAEFSNVSADAIRAAEAGLVKKVVGHQRTFGEAWEEVIRLALGVLGDPRADDQSSFVEWSDPESRTVAELADATVKLAPYLPQDETWARLGYSPQQRAQFSVEMMSQALAGAISQPPGP